ncbi:transposase [Sinorhizobium meliloti]|uniref:transposase n=2 Tax=Rhizobium meliloti TaxID=382 RepID=UPI0009BBFA76|nr:hypothetical protein CN213_20410 [Sinorhizobium meliloti]RVP38206.1 hypothetical protein CN109_08225 [Sinorhizobium meliloti]
MKALEAEMATADVCRCHGTSSAKFYKWKSMYDGLEVSEAQRLRTFEEENLRVRLRGGCKRALGARTPMVLPDGQDFVSDTFACSRRPRNRDCGNQLFARRQIEEPIRFQGSGDSPR